jgi:pimeloyl-ACP methyl ester carboxylesterase
MPYFEHKGLQIHYHTYGSGPPVVFLHGLLHRNWMQNRLADLASRRFEAIAMEFSGHGESDAPDDPAHYSLAEFADETNALLEHLELESAIVHGTSLGANVLLEMLVLHPHRLAGAVVEMPVLAGSYSFAKTIFGPLATALEIASPGVALLASALGRIPRFNPDVAILLDIVPKNPHQAAAVLRGLIQNTPRPEFERYSGVRVPVLVIGHPRDPLHSYEDAKRLVEVLPQGELLTAKSMVELRLSPSQLWPKIEEFYDRCFAQVSPTMAG